MDLLQHLDVPNVSDSSDNDDFLQELAALNDVGLLRATMESLECGRLTPLIKEELRCRIQSRRLSEGKEELLVEFPSPTPSQPRPDEMEKRDRRREQNRRAAQKFRRKKKERGAHLMEETQRLECQNTSLRSEIKQLHEERDQLTRIIQSHASICPLTPRQSPLTIPRESPIPGSIRDSPLTLPSPGNILAASPVLGKSSVLSQSPALLVPPTRESPVPLLIINPGGEGSVSASLISSSPIPMSCRPRKSPVSLLRIIQSPVPGDKIGAKSPIPFGSPPKQCKHSIPARLNLAGPKPVIPILPKPAPSSFPSSPSPKTPRTFITSPLPIAPSPVSGGRAIHVSPVFFRDGCFTPSGQGRQLSHSPVSVSNSSNSSTPGRITQQSPVFFGDRAPASAQSGSHFLQPLSASSISSTSSLASLLRQESPLSVLSNSSGISNASSVFISTNLNSIAENAPVVGNNSSSNICNRDNHIFGNLNSFPDKPRSVCSASSQSSFPENPEDNVLCLEDIEKSASGFEARDDLLDFMDIQALLELSGDHNGHSLGETNTDQSGNAAGCHSMNPSRGSMEDLVIDQSSDVLDSDNCRSSNSLLVSSIRQRDDIRDQPSLQSQDQILCARLLAHSLNAVHGEDPGDDIIDSSDMLDQRRPPLGVAQGACCDHSGLMTRETNQREDSFSGAHKDTFSNLCGMSGDGGLHNYSDSQAGNATLASSIQQFHSQLRELISSQNGLSDSSTLRNLLTSDASNVRDGGGRSNETHMGHNNSISQGDCCAHTGDGMPASNNASSSLSSDHDLMALNSSFSLDVLMTSHGTCNHNTKNVLSQASQKFS